ncbi:glycoside hydrolase family 32 protein [Rossellomorea marisflavi]|uniref:glycoside hydrolase family 32 protein n=1 Tax=Rossellomorea marisflavi TaxID=189381 RepID=UPI003D2EA3F6
MTNQTEKEVYTEKFRPQFHFSPREKWMNDPNGMVYFEGEYHLFFQYHPDGNTWGPMHWGHAVSKDLVHWEELPIALYPDELGTIFSGSAVVDWHNTSGFFKDGKPGLVAIYTNHDTDPISGDVRQRQSVAYSVDKGRSWSKYEGNPVLENASEPDYRDPKVFWHGESGKWVMVLATGQSITIYHSPDLLQWTYASTFGHEEGSHAGVWECPDLFRLECDGKERWVMLVSIGDHPDTIEGSRTQYFIGDFDGKTFINENPADLILWLDHGRDNYAGVSWSDLQDERRIYIGWMSNWRYANEVPTDGWRSAMTLPRELGLKKEDSGYRLVQHPVRELDVLSGAGKEKMTPYSLHEGETYQERMQTNLAHLHFETEADTNSVWALTIRHGREEVSLFTCRVGEGTITLDRRRSGIHAFSASFPAVQSAEYAEGERGGFHLYIDTSSIEVFSTGGELAMTSLIFPEGESIDFEFKTLTGNVVLKEWKVSQLRSIWS